MTVEHVEQQPADCDVAGSGTEGLRLFRKHLDESTEETVGRELETDELLRQVDGDAVESDDGEEQRPTPPAQHVYDVVEQGEHHQGVASDHESETAGPQLFVDREIQAPQQSRRQQQQRRHSHRRRLPSRCHPGTVALHPFAGEHSHQRRGDGGQGAEDSFGVDVAVAESSGQQHPVDVAHDAALGRIDVGSHTVWGWNKAHQQPVAYEQHRNDDRAHSPSGMQTNQGGEHPGQPYATEHAGIARLGEVPIIEDAVVHDAQHHEQQTAAQHLQVDFPFAASRHALLLHREGEGDTRDEEEKRKNGVVVRQAVPLDVGHLASQLLGECRGEPGSQGRQQGRTTHDEKHVETAQGIERLQSWSFLCHRVRLISLGKDKEL